MPVLLCRHLDRRIDWKVTVDDGDFTIGCSEAATVPVPDATIAPREAAILKKGERYLLQDLSEKGRIVLGGTVTRTGLLKDGDRFRIGRISILFLEHSNGVEGQVELYRDAAPSFELLDVPLPAPALKRTDPVISNADEIPRGVWAGVLILAVFSGLCLGILVWGPPRDSTAASAGLTENLGGSREPAGATPAPQVEREQRLRSHDAANGRGSTPEPSVNSTASPPRFALAPTLDARASRLALFRLFLDLASRPPTRGEERELLPLDHEGRWRRILDAARREGTLSDLKSPIEAQFFSFIGRKPSLVEVQEIATVTTEERPAAFWITALEEYRRPDRRRLRSSAARARSLVVDLLDREPSGVEEMETVRAAISTPGSVLDAARALVHSPKGRQVAGAAAEGDWESEVFRFLLREPTPAERIELGGAWDRLDPSERRAWLLLALASHEDYAKY